MLKLKINQDHPEIERLIPKLQETFKETGTTIYKIRNEVKTIDFEGKKLCIKSFGKPNIINYFVYSFIRKTKARRSYENSLRFLQMGIETPKPLAYVEYYNNKGFIQNSYYISFYDEHSFTMEDVMTTQIENKEDIIKAFAHYAFHSLHKKGILHLDFGGNNILVKEKNKEYSFSIIDLNRVRFKSNKLTPRQGLFNLKRLTGGPVEISILAGAYAGLCNQNPLKFAVQLLNFRLRYISKRDFRRSFFKPFKRYFITK